MMQILFVHQNYPAQFGEFALYLGQRGWDVWFMTAAEHAKSSPLLKIVRMTPHRDPTQGVHRFARGLEKAMINGQAFANAAIAARSRGLNPDVVVAHSGWGSGTFAKAVWPECKYVSYVEWFYRYPLIDETTSEPVKNVEDARAHAVARNAPTLLDLEQADLVFCPSHFQAEQFPQELRCKFVIMQDGVDTRRHAPNPDARPTALPSSLARDTEVITYVTRGMEPHRGFPEFIKALSQLQKERPNLHAVIGGEDRVCYGKRLPEGNSWKARMLETFELDLERITWTGLLRRDAYIEVLQRSDAHVYLTVPFVLSWSLIEAMSIGCPIIASSTKPVGEVMTHGVSGHMVDHSDHDALVRAISSVLDNKALASELGKNARARAIDAFSSEWIFPWRARQIEDLCRFGAPTHS